MLSKCKRVLGLVIAAAILVQVGSAATASVSAKTVNQRTGFCKLINAASNPNSLGGGAGEGEKAARLIRAALPTVPAKLKSPFKIVAKVYQRTANGDDPSVVIREAGGFQRVKQKLAVLSNVFDRAVNGKTVDDVLNRDGPEARDAFARAAGFYLSYYQANCKT